MAVSGANKDSFLPVQDIIINVVEAPLFPPQITDFSISSITAGADISFQCTQQGTAFFALSTDNATLNAMTIDSVIAATQTVGLEQTNPDPSDQFFTKYAFVDVAVANVTRSLSLGMIAANKDYNIFGVCLALSNKASAVTFLNWTQVDNGQRPVVAFFNFSQALTRANLIRFACAFSTVLS